MTMIIAPPSSNPTAPAETVSTTTNKRSRGGLSYRNRSSSIVSLNGEDVGEVYHRRPAAAKRAKVVDENAARALRLQQNREASRKSRQRKKMQEKELQQSIAFFTQSNEALKKQNRELQRMLDMGRSTVASLLASDAGKTMNPPTQTSQPSTIVGLPPPQSQDSSSKTDQEIQPCIVRSDMSQTETSTTSSNDAYSSDLSDEKGGGCDYIELLLENDDWLVNNSEEVKEGKIAQEVEAEASDECGDHIDFLLENDDWLTNEGGSNGGGSVTEAAVTVTSSSSSTPTTHTTAHQPTLIPAPRHMQVVSPISSLHLLSTNTNTTNSNNNNNNNNETSANNAVRTSSSSGMSANNERMNNTTTNKKLPTTRECRLEKNREAARQRRLRKKKEHETLRQSVAFFTKSNESLRKKNEELQLMILQARSKVAETTDGFQHYTTVFGGRGDNNNNIISSGSSGGANNARLTANVNPTPMVSPGNYDVTFSSSAAPTAAATVSVSSSATASSLGNTNGCDNNTCDCTDDGLSILLDSSDDDTAWTSLWT